MRRQKTFRGKSISILGDSISTLEGYLPVGYKAFYTAESSPQTGIHAMEDTWWGQVIKELGATLLVNNSWSGSCVTKKADSELSFPSGCSPERTSDLHMSGLGPDVIIVFLGFNDWANGRPLYAPVLRHVDKTCWFFNSYSEMLRLLRKNYTKAKVYCCTLCKTAMKENERFVFPSSFRGTHIKEYNKAIHRAALLRRCSLIDLYAYNQPYDSLDGSHPSYDGMKTLADLFLKSIL